MGGFIGSPEVNTLAFNADYRTCTTAAGKLHSLASFAVFASRFLKVFMKLLALWPIMYQYLQVVENILYSGSADMKVQAHDLNVSITSVSSRFRKSLKKFVSFESFFSFLFVFFFYFKLRPSIIQVVWSASPFFSGTKIHLLSQNCFKIRLV